MPKKRGPGNGSDYDVGYGKPPKHSQFKPGRSGNAKGRPRKVRNIKTEFLAVVRKPVRITVNGKQRNVDSITAMFMRVMQKAMNGDIRAVHVILDNAEKYGIGEADGSSQDPLSVEDRGILASYLEELKGRSGQSGRSDQ